MVLDRNFLCLAHLAQMYIFSYGKNMGDSILAGEVFEYGLLDNIEPANSIMGFIPDLKVGEDADEVQVVIEFVINSSPFPISDFGLDGGFALMKEWAQV